LAYGQPFILSHYSFLLVGWPWQLDWWSDDEGENCEIYRSEYYKDWEL